jgi:hypothetical protein
MRRGAGGRQRSVYVSGPRRAGYGTTLLARTATGSFGSDALLAGRGWIGEDGQLLWGTDPLPEQLQLALNLIETTLRSRQLRTKLLGLAPQPPRPHPEVAARHDEQQHPDHYPPHADGLYPLAGVDPADPAYASRAARAPW